MKIEFQAPLLQILLPVYLLQFPSSADPVKNKEIASQNVLLSYEMVIYHLDDLLTLHAENAKMAIDRKELITWK